jgi:hypothetical protein
MKKLYSFFFAVVSLAFGSFSQISDGGQPISFGLSSNILNQIQAVDLAKPNILHLQQQDNVNDALGRAYRVGTLIQVNLTPMNSGTWTTLSDGSKIWQLQIKSKDALALGLYFSEEVVLPAGAKLFAFNKNKNHIIGAYTSNTPRFQAMQMVEGDVLTLEYHAPAHLVALPTIHINEVGYFYRGVEDFVNQFKPNATPKADACQVDVACTPESTGWAEQIRSVVHYTFNQSGSTFVCSAATINNTANDCKPYILTAWHCGERAAGSSISSWVWYWNYQKTTCQPNANGTNPSKGNQTMTGGQVRASSGSGTLNNPPANSSQVAGSDFYLVELNSNIPTSYNPYFAGWDRNNTGATSGVGIHHPAGSAKKISTFTSTLTNTSFNGGGNGHFWRVIWSATTNGHGVTEGGSSGSPIFNQNKLIVGQLTGGSSMCNATNQPDVYGKLRSDWDLCGTTNTAQLKPWLDPTNSGVLTLLGHSCGSGGGGGGGYCAATATHACATGDEYVANVTLNTINNTSGCAQYSNFTAQSTTLARGQQYTVSIGTAIVGSQNVAYLNDQIAAWIDYNNNQTFETNERIGLTTVAQNTPFPIQYTFTVPQTASLGNVRMRVRLNYQPDDGNIDPCGTYQWGETEDYTLNIVNSGGGSGASIDDEAMDALLIYPNPSSGEFFIDATQLGLESFSLQVFDIHGAMLKEEQYYANDLVQLDLSQLAKGVYNIRLISGDYVLVKRVVIQ